MKRIIIILAVFTLALSACTGKDHVVGCTPAERKAGDKKCFSTGNPTIPPTATPTTRPPTTRPPTSKPPTVKPDPGYKGKVYPVVIRSSADGYSPRDIRLYVGDIIKFTNLDPNSEHSYTEDKGHWNSGKLKNGKSWTYTVTAPPGIYNIHDEVVPYVLGGPVQVLPAPK